MQRGIVYLSIGEEAVVDALRGLYGITEFEAVQQVIKQKRDLAIWHWNRGNKELGEHLLSEIGEKK